MLKCADRLGINKCAETIFAVAKPVDNVLIEGKTSVGKASVVATDFKYSTCYSHGYCIRICRTHPY